MARRTRRNHAPAFKAKVALSALKSDRSGAADLHRSTTPPSSAATRNIAGVSSYFCSKR
jgi:hypothetical protein